MFTRSKITRSILLKAKERSAHSVTVEKVAQNKISTEESDG
jgi:hypothetical protein